MSAPGTMDSRYMPVTRHSFRSATLAALLAGIALACPVQVSATQQDLFELSLEELGNIAITGPTLTKKKLSNVPASVTVFTRDEIRQLPVSTIEQLMNYVPGFQSARSSDNSMGQPYSVRGRKFGVSGREVLVMINGMRIENFFTGGGANTYPAIPLANIARVEFIRGPGSALYGSNALTGMINIITDEAHNHLGANAGDPEQATVNWLQQLDTAGIDGSLFLQGYRHNGEDYQVQDTFSPNIISTHDPQRSSDALLQLTFNRHTRLQLLAAERDINDFYVTGFLSDGFSHYDTRYYHGLLEHTLAWSDAITSSFQAGYSHFSMPVNSQATPAGALAAISAPSSTDPLQFRSEVVTNETWMRWLNDWKLDDSKSLQFGLSYRNPAIDSAPINSNFDLQALHRQEFPVTYREDFGNRSTVAETAGMDIAAAFAQYQTKLGEQADLVLGARYDSYSQIGSHVSPRIALTLHPSTSDSFKLLYGRAFDAPMGAELYSINNPILEGNPDLQPETVDTWEIIWLRQWQMGTFTANYFYNRFHDSIAQVVVDGVRTYDNISHENSDGMEFELASQLHANFSLRASVTHLFSQPDSSFRESDQLFALIGRFQQSFGYATLTLNQQSDKQTLSNNGATRETLDGFWLANLKLGYYAGRNLEGYVEVMNLGDVDYTTPSMSGNIADGIPNRRRELRLGVAWEY